MKKKLTLVLLLCLILLGSSIFGNRIPSLNTIVYAENLASGTCGTNVTWTLSDLGTLTISGNGAMEEYAFMSSYFYTGSTAPWTANSDTITSVVVQNGVTTVGSYAFCGLDKVTSISLPNTLTTIGEGAFYGCTALGAINLPTSVTTLKTNAFGECTNLQSITIPGSISKIDFSLFMGCTGLKSVILSNGVTYIDGRAFEKCTSLTSIQIPNTVTYIESAAFYNCTGLTSITIPESVTYIGWYILQGCSSLQSVNLMANVTTIPYATFIDCKNLTNVTLSDSITNIGEYAFRGCTALKDIPKNNTLLEISDYAFLDCAGLKTAHVQNNVTKIGHYAFQNCTQLEAVTIPNSVTFFGQSAFENCSSLKSVYIPSSVGDIGSFVFKGCTNLATVTIEKGISRINTRSFQDCKSLKTIIIPEGVLSIGWEAFKGCTALTDVTCSEGLIIIYESAFRDCTALKSIILPESQYTSVSINKEAFLNCTSLLTVSLPKKIYSIENNAFGYTFDTSYKKIPGFKLFCYAGTSGETYAINNQLSYELTKENLVPKDITKLPISYYTSQSIYSGSPFTPDVSVPNLIENVDFTVTYENNLNVGTATIIVTGIGNYTGIAKQTFTISPCNLTTNYAASLSEYSFTHTGLEIKPTVTILNLVENKDFTVKYTNNINVGTAIATITGKGNYTGSIKKTYVINDIAAKDLTKLIIHYSLVEYIYDGNAHTPAVSIDGLVQNTDYLVTYENNINPGSATIIVTGIGKYAGTAKKSFTIAPFINDPTTKLSTIELLDAGVRLAWGAEKVLGYRVFRSTSSAEEGSSLTDFYLTSTSFADVTTQPSTTYYYTIRGVLSEANPYTGTKELLGDVIASLTTTTKPATSTTNGTRNFMILQINNPFFTINGIQNEISPGRSIKPIILANRTLVPIRAIVEGMGGTVQWDPSTKKITMTARGNTLIMWIDKTDININGVVSKMDVAPKIVNSSTYVPVRFVAQNLNCEVEWISSSQEAVIIYSE